MSLELPTPTDLEIADGITTAIADLNKYLGAAKDVGMRVDVDYVTESSFGGRYGCKIYHAEIFRPVRCAS